MTGFIDSSAIETSSLTRSSDLISILDGYTRRPYVITGDVLTGLVNVRRYGAVGDGVTDDAPAILAAHAAAQLVGKALYIPAGTYRMSIGFPALTTSTRIFGDGDATTLLWRENSTLFTITSVSDVTLSDFRVYKDTATSGTVNKAIVFSASKRCRLTNLTIEGMTGIGVTVSWESGPRIGGLLHGCHFFSNTTALSVLSTGGYTTVSNCLFHGNTTAITCASGNVNFLDCRCDNNVSGFVLTGGGNDGHGSWIGGSLNHNTGNAITGTNVANGYRFIGAMIYEAAMSFTGCTRFIFSGCDITNSGTQFIVVNTCTRFVFDDLSGTTTPQWTIDTAGTVLVRLVDSAGIVKWFDPKAPTTSLVSLPVNLLAKDFTDDVAAAAGSVPVGGIYHNTGALRIRRT